MASPFSKRSKAEAVATQETYSWAAAPECVWKWQEEFEELADCLMHAFGHSLTQARFNTKTGRVEIYVEIYSDTRVVAEIEVQTSGSKPDQITIRCQRRYIDAIELFFKVSEGAFTIIGNL